MANQVAVDVEQAWPYIQKRLERYLAGASLGSGGSAGGATVGEHALDGPLHSGTLARTQAPWVATDIASAVASHAALPDVHHARQHSITDSVNHTITGAALSVVGATALNTLGLLTPSAAPGAAEALLKSSSAGDLTLPTFTATTRIRSPLLDTGSGNLSITPAGGITAITGALTVSTTVSVGNGSTSTPGLNFGSDTDTGIYRSGTNAFGLVAGGAAIINIGATGAAVNTSFDSTAAFKVQSAANDDITLFLKQKSGQTARMWRVEDSAGQELIVLDSAGNLQSGNPGFTSGVRGWQVTPPGNAEFNNAWIRGELHASIFVMDEFHASGGTLYIAPAGKLENDATVYTTTAVQEVLDVRTTSGTFTGTQVQVRTTSGTFSGTTVTRRYIKNYFDISDPPSGHAMILSAGDIIRCKALGLSVGIDLWDIWGVVSYVEDQTTFYRYYYDRKSGGADGLVIPAGTAIISYGKPGDGRIYLTADQNYAPYWQVFITGNEPWNGDIIPTVRGGRLDGVGLPGVSGIPQYGIVMSTDLSDASAPYMVMSNLQQFMYNIDSEWNNGNPTARITSGGIMKLGIDIDNQATTGFDFNPVTGALIIGSASYSGSVTVYGSITVTSGSGYGNFSDKPTSLSGINASEGTKLSGIAANATVGATWGTNLNSIPTRFGDAPGAAGLYLTPTHLGYYDGSAWKAWIASGGQFYFGGSSGAHLEWNGSKLRGIGTDGTTEQWYAQASDGKLYAAAGAIGLDSTGIWLRMNASSSWTTASAITFRNASTFSTIDAVLSTKTVTSSRYLNLLIDPDTTPVGLEIIASPAAQRVNITHDLTVVRDLTVSGVLYPGDVDMNGNDIYDIGRIGETWNGLSFGSGWANYGSGWNNGQVKKVGDLVFVRGLVYRFTGSGTTIATLPSGYRPPAGVIFAVDTNTGHGRVDIDSSGVMTLTSGGASNISLSGIVFSTL